MSLIVQTHSYNIVMSNVLYYRKTSSGTLGFKMVDGTGIITTCPYRKGVNQITDQMGVHMNNSHVVITLDYYSKPIRVKKRLAPAHKHKAVQNGNNIGNVVRQIVKAQANS
jgi:hypothetical protein